MTISTSFRTRRTATTSAPRISMRRGMIMSDSRRESRAAPRPTWIGSPTVQR